MTPRVHKFETTREAYSASQTGAISDGDVLVARREHIVGIMVAAWPVSIFPARRGDFHALVDGAEWAAVPGDDGGPRDYSDSLRVANEQADVLGVPPVEFLAHYVHVTFRRRYGGRVGEDESVRALIDKTGYVQLDMYRRDSHEEQMKMHCEWVGFLVENEIAEWKPIGPEDSELFLTSEWEERMASQLGSLSGWEVAGGD